MVFVFDQQVVKLKFAAVQHKRIPMNVEFRRLQANARPAIRAHLDAMTAEDRFTRFGFEVAYFSPSWTAFQAERGRDFSVIVDGISN
jgi:hypothetical protein